MGTWARDYSAAMRGVMQLLKGHLRAFREGLHLEGYEIRGPLFDEDCRMPSSSLCGLYGAMTV